jgi:hypothetical protein
MRAHGLDKAWWLIETNAPVVDDPSWPVASITLNVTQQDQARFMPQAIATALAAGVDKIGIFKLIDTETDREANPEPFGLIRSDGTYRPAFDAYRVAIEQMNDVTYAVRERWDTIALVRLEHANGTVTHVLFSRVGFVQQVAVPARSNFAQLIDQFGVSRTILPDAGDYHVELPASPCSQPIADHCMIGGTTYYLVQGVSEALTLPTEQEMETPTPTAEPTNTPVPTSTPTPTPSKPATSDYLLASFAVFFTAILLIGAFMMSLRYVF